MSTVLLAPFVRPSCQWCDDVFIAGTHPKSTCGKECRENLKRLREDLKYDMTPNVPVSHEVMLCILKTLLKSQRKFGTLKRWVPLMGINRIFQNFSLI